MDNQTSLNVMELLSPCIRVYLYVYFIFKNCFRLHTFCILRKSMRAKKWKMNM